MRLDVYDLQSADESRTHVTAQIDALDNAVAPEDRERGCILAYARRVKVFTDGGVISRNPSTVGGTWAFCVLGSNGRLILKKSGVLPVGTWGLETISNNVTELLAVMMALRSLPDDIQADVYTDSLVTLRRCVDGERAKWNGIPPKLRALTLRHVKRLGGSNWILLAGHPTKADLAQGYKNKSNGHRWPVSEHNVECDRLCGVEAKAEIERQAALTFLEAT